MFRGRISEVRTRRHSRWTTPLRPLAMAHGERGPFYMLRESHTRKLSVVIWSRTMSVVRRLAHRIAGASRRHLATASLYIDGAVCGASDGATVEVFAPRDGSVLTSVSDASAEDAARAVGAAHAVKVDGGWARDVGARRAAIGTASPLHQGHGRAAAQLSASPTA